MSSSDIDSIYEKMYTYEEQIKDNISIKTQLLFTAIFILISTAVYLARFLDFSTRPDIAYVITALVISVALIAGLATYFNCKAFSGSEFNRMPYASKVQEYYEQQIQYNTEVEQYNSDVEPDDAIPTVDPKKETSDFIDKTYAACATHNALVNERRSRQWFKAFTAFLSACVPLAVASLLFVTFDMDTSSPRKNLSIKDSYVGGEIASLRQQLSESPSSKALADLEKRTMLLEHLILQKMENGMSDTKKGNNAEKKSKPPAPVKPSAPPSRMTYDHANGGQNRKDK